MDDIVKDYEFFSVNSNVVPRSIFQGFIGAVPKNIIIYEALKDIYFINPSILQKEYLKIVRNLYTIYHSIVKEDNIKTHLYYEDWFIDKAKVFDENARVLLTHHTITKVIPM